MYQKFRVPSPLARHSFLHSIATSGETTSRYLFQRGSFAKRTIICENSYNRENN